MNKNRFSYRWSSVSESSNSKWMSVHYIAATAAVFVAFKHLRVIHSVLSIFNTLFLMYSNIIRHHFFFFLLELHNCSVRESGLS